MERENITENQKHCGHVFRWAKDLAVNECLICFEIENPEEGASGFKGEHDSQSKYTPMGIDTRKKNSHMIKSLLFKV